jgi:hypothetical protein
MWKISWVQYCPSWYWLLGPQPKRVKFSKQNSFSVAKKAYAEIFSSIPCQISKIFGKTVGFLGLGPSPTGHLRKKKKFWDMTFCQKNFSLFYSASPEIIGVEFCDRQTHRQSHEFLDTKYGWVCVFSPVKIFYLPTRFARRGLNILHAIIGKYTPP